MLVVNHARSNTFSKRLGTPSIFGVDHQNMELAGDPTVFHLKEKVHVSLEAH
jgi:hypothetical protein